MHRVLPVSEQPRMHAGKQPYAFASNGSKKLRLLNRKHVCDFFDSANAKFNTPKSSKEIFVKYKQTYCISSFPLRYSGNRFHFKQQRLLNGADPICLRLSFLSEHPPKTHQQKPACLLGIFHIPRNDRHFSPVQRALRQIPTNRWV